MDKYLENEINPLPLIEYDQRSIEIKRTFNLKEAYLKLSTPYKGLGAEAPKGNLICIGNTGAGKSQFLNEMLKMSFELQHKASIGLFHDSVDVTFATGVCIPTEFNVFDFQGERANEDFELICDMLEHLPFAYLLVQVNEETYLARLFHAMTEKQKNDKLLEKFQERIIVLSRCPQSYDEIEISMLEYFGQYDNFDTNERIFNIADSDGTGNQVSYDGALVEQTQNKSAEVFKFLQSEMKRLESIFVQEIGEDLKYKHLFGMYWLFEDKLGKLGEKENNIIIRKEEDFRCEHMKLKEDLYALEHMLTNDKLFPLYDNIKQYMKVEKNMRMLDRIPSIDELEDFNQEKIQIKEAERQVQHGPIYDSIERFYSEGRHALFFDSLAQMAARFKTETTHLKKQVEAIATKIETITKKQHELVVAKQQAAVARTDEDDQTEELKEHEIEARQQNAMDENENEHEKISDEKIDLQKQLDKKVEEMNKNVIDAELFFRDAKRKSQKLDKKSPEFIKFHRHLGETFMKGQPIEVIDGDVDDIDDVSLPYVMSWVQDQKKNNSELFVVSIMGAQSTGKSTLLNYLLGSNFRVSAGRCTKGLNATLFVTDVPGAKEMLLLDSEGLFSTERTDPMFDRRLATFCVANSNFLMINIKGELSTDVQDVLENVVYTIGRLPTLNTYLKRARFHFVLRDQTDAIPAQMKDSYRKLRKQLELAAQAAGAPSLDSLIDLPTDTTEAFSIFSCAISPQSITSNSEYKPIEFSLLFRESCADLRKKILNYAKNLQQEKRVLNLQKWTEEAIMIWKTLKQSDDFAKIKNLKHIQDHRELVDALQSYENLMTNSSTVFDKKVVEKYQKDKKKVAENHKDYAQKKKNGEDMDGVERKEKVAELTGKNALLNLANISPSLEDKVDIAYERTVSSQFDKVLEDSKEEVKIKFKTVKSNKLAMDYAAEMKVKMRKLKEDIYMDHQQWATIYAKDMSLGLPIQARLAVDGVISSILTEYNQKYVLAMNKLKKDSFTEELTELIEQQKREGKSIQEVKQSVSKEKQKLVALNKLQLQVKENEIRRQAVQTFRKVAAEHLKAFTGENAGQDEESKCTALPADKDRYSMIRTDAPCIRQAPSEFQNGIYPTSCLINDEKNVTQEKIQAFAKVDEITLKAAIEKIDGDNEQLQALTHEITEIIKNDFVTFSQDLVVKCDVIRKKHVTNDVQNPLNVTDCRDILRLCDTEMKKHRDSVEKKNEIFSGLTRESSLVDFKKVCITYQSLQFVSDFEDILFEMIYRRLRHNDDKQLSKSQSIYNVAEDTLVQQIDKLYV